MLASHLNNLIVDCKIQRFSLIKIQKLFLNSRLNNSKTKKIVVLVGIEVLNTQNIGKRIGAPIPLGADCKITPALASTLQKANSNAAAGAASKGHACLVANQDQPPIKRNSHPVPCDGGQLPLNHIGDISGSGSRSGVVSRVVSGPGTGSSSLSSLSSIMPNIQMGNSHPVPCDGSRDGSQQLPLHQLNSDISGSGVVYGTGSSSLASVRPNIQIQMVKCDCVKCSTCAGPFFLTNQDEMMVGSCPNTNCNSLGPFNISYTCLPEIIPSWRNTQLNLLIGNSGTVSGSSILSPGINQPQIKIVKFACTNCGFINGPFYLQRHHQLTVGTCPTCKSEGPFNLSSSMMTANKTVYTLEWLREAFKKKKKKKVDKLKNIDLSIIDKCQLFLSLFF